MGRARGRPPVAAGRSSRCRPTRRTSAGAETGLASTRAELLTLLPRSRRAARRSTSYEDWARFAELLVELGLADDLMRLWWDVRPHPRLGTLEIRMPDQPTRLAATGGARRAVPRARRGRRPGGRAGRPRLYAQNRWAAARFGAAGGARSIPRTTGSLPQLRELLELSLAEPRARRHLIGARRARPGGRAARGRAARDGLRALCERLVALTYDDL